MTDWPFKEPRFGTVHVGGSHGYMEVDRASGVIIQALLDGDGYADILIFDVIPFRRNPECDAFDILDTAYLTRDGTYVEALVPEYRDGEFWGHTELRLLTS